MSISFLFGLIALIVIVVAVIGNVFNDDEDRYYRRRRNRRSDDYSDYDQGGYPPMPYGHYPPNPYGPYPPPYGSYRPYRPQSNWATLLIILAFGAGLLYFFSATRQNGQDANKVQDEETRPNVSPEPTKPRNERLDEIFTPRRGEVLSRFTDLNDDGTPRQTNRRKGVEVSSYPTREAAQEAAIFVANKTGIDPDRMYLVGPSPFTLIIDCKNISQAEAVQVQLEEQYERLRPFCPSPPRVTTW